jgi:flagellar basal-body rod protein FlgC
MFGALETSTSALVAQRTRMDAVAGNIANAFTLVDAQGRPNPYKRREVLFAQGNPAAGPDVPGVHVAEIREDPTPGRLEWAPWHPQAIQDGRHKGYVRMPNVELSTEMVNAIEASRAYEANVTVMDVTKSMIASSLRLLA